MKALIAVVAGLGFVSAASANIILDFQSLEMVDANIHDWGHHYEEDGYQVDKSGVVFEFATFGTLEGRYPGSTALFSNEVDATISVSALDGSSFDLVSIDISNLNNNGPITVNFTGNLTGGGSVFQSYTTTGAQNVLETVAFVGFTGLDSVEWVQIANFHQFDNVTIVPAPASLALLGLGGLAIRRRR